jgi:hypothetical protein
LKFESAADQKAVQAIIAQEPLTEILTAQQELSNAVRPGDHQPFYGGMIYLITQKATVIGLWFDFCAQSVIKMAVTHHLSELIQENIYKMVAHQTQECLHLAILIENNLMMVC